MTVSMTVWTAQVPVPITRLLTGCPQRPRSVIMSLSIDRQNCQTRQGKKRRHGSGFGELAAAVTDGQEPSLAGQHAPKGLETFAKPDIEKRRVVHVPHGHRLISEEIARVDMAVAVDRRLHVGDGAVCPL